MSSEELFFIFFEYISETFFFQFYLSKEIESELQFLPKYFLTVPLLLPHLLVWYFGWSSLKQCFVNVTNPMV